MSYVISPAGLVVAYPGGSSTWTLYGTPTSALSVVVTDIDQGGNDAKLRFIVDGVDVAYSAVIDRATNPQSVDLSALTLNGGGAYTALAGLTLAFGGGDYDEPGTLALSFATIESTSVVTGAVTLAAIRDTVRQRVDMVGSSFVTDDELNGWINASAHELYDLLVQKFGPGNYFVAEPYAFTADGSSDGYAMPRDLYKLLGVDLMLGGSDSWATVKPFNFSERNRYAYPNIQSATIPANVRYRIMGASLLFTPRAQAGQQFRLWYVPKMTPLSVDTDTLEGVSGWEEYVVADVAIKALSKEESDASVFMAQKQALTLRIESAAENRDAGSPATVSDSQGADFVWSGNGAGGYR